MTFGQRLTRAKLPHCFLSARAYFSLANEPVPEAMDPRELVHFNPDSHDGPEVHALDECTAECPR